MRAIKLENGHEWLTRPQPALLADSLEVLRLQSCILGYLDSKMPLAIRFNGRLGWIHLVGRPCAIELEQEPGAVQMAAGDLIIVFPGNGHHLHEDPAVVARPVEELLEAFQCGGMDSAAGQAGGPFTSLISGYFALAGFERTLLHASLPAMIHVRGYRQRPLPFVEHLLRLGIEESASPEPCTPLIVNRLVRILLIKVLQRHVSTMSRSEGNWLRAISDPEIGRALALMHDQPQAPWTVAALAEQAAMSRSVFSARFTALMGKPPLEYLFAWRMLKASYLLRTTRTELKEVAVKVGYESAAAFSKAFTRWAGVPPGSYRQSVRSEPAFDSPAKIRPFNSAGGGRST